MPLPILSSSKKQDSGVLSYIKSVFNKPKQEEKTKETLPADIFRDLKNVNPNSSSLPSKIKNSDVEKLDSVKPSRIKNNSGSALKNDSAISKNQEINQRAIEKSRRNENPLVPLIQSIDSTLSRNG